MPNKELSRFKKLLGFSPENLEPKPTHQELRKLFGDPSPGLFESNVLYYTFEEVTHVPGQQETIIRRVTRDGTEEFSLYGGDVPISYYDGFTTEELTDAFRKQEWTQNRRDLR